MKDLVSIIVPVYNADKFIQETINSVLNQTYNNFELLLIEDMSTDKSIEIIKKNIEKDSRIKLITNTKKQGAAGVRNIGIKEAKGRFIAYIDADDYWVKTKL